MKNESDFHLKTQDVWWWTPYLLWEAIALTPVFRAKFVLYIREDKASMMLDIYLKSS